MEIINALKTVESNPEYRVLRKFNGLPAAYHTPAPEDRVFKVCFLDTETTSLDTFSCKVIDLAMRVVEFGSDGRLFRVGEAYQEFNDPGEPLSEDVKAVTGYTDEMLVGKSIDWSEVSSIVSDCALVVAYNSQYDRPVLERFCPAFAELNWGCAMVDVDWFGLFGTKGKLEWLAYKIESLFFEAHQAIADVDIMVHMLSILQPGTQTTVFSKILDQARQKRFRIRAVGAPFDAKDQLKKSGYQWEDDGVKQKAWCKSVVEAEMQSELSKLSEMGCRSPQINPILIKDRFTNRI
jgi:DNA polymerase-3 subunit epsilon